MNREAAALGVPVYSIFRGRIGDVDRYLAQTGRLVLLESLEDVQSKLVIRKRESGKAVGSLPNKGALQGVVAGIVEVLKQTNGQKGFWGS